MSTEEPCRPLTVAVEVLPHAVGLGLPAYATPGSAGMDLCAALAESVTVAPRERRLIPTGLRLGLPPGYEAQVRPRSGLALRHGITLPNAPATIDSDYRGELQVILINLGEEPYVVQRGARIAQLLVAPVTRVAWTPVPALDATARGAGGFGHTGS